MLRHCRHCTAECIMIWSTPEASQALHHVQMYYQHHQSGTAVMLGAASRLIFSSAWDYSVRMWRRASPHTCASVLTFPDWVWSVKPKGHTLLVQPRCAAGARGPVEMFAERPAK